MPDLLHAEVFRKVLEELQVGVYFTDLERRIVFWNAGAERITGYLRQEVVGRLCRDNLLAHCDHKQLAVCGSVCPLAEAMAEGRARDASLFLRHKSGHRVPIRIHTMPIRDAQGAIVGAAECFQRQRYLPEAERREGGGFHCVEGSPGYESLLAEVRLRLGRLHESGVSFGVLCLAVDHFEELRSGRGREACETILHVIVNTLQNTIRPGDCIGALPDGRLMLVLSSSTPEALMHAGERLRALVSCSNVVWWGDKVQVSVSAGGTIATVGDTVETVMARVQRALEESRGEGGDRVTVRRE